MPKKQEDGWAEDIATGFHDFGQFLLVQCLAYRHCRGVNTNYLTQRTHLIHQMASLQSMEHGSLKAEYRNSSGDGQTGQVGPYYKHQVWQDGRNVSRRISVEEAPGLAAAIANRQRFEALAAQFVDLTVAHTRQCQAATAQKKRAPTSSSRRKRKSRN